MSNLSSHNSKFIEVTEVEEPNGTWQACRKHPNRAATYYCTQQSWVSFCSKCALQYALAGRKIERRFSEQEMVKKIQIEGFLFNLKLWLSRNEEGQAQAKEKLAQLQNEYQMPAEEVLRFCDEQVDFWTGKRNELFRVYSEGILSHCRQLEEIKSKCMFGAIQLKQTLAETEASMNSLIHETSSSDFAQTLSKLKQLVSKHAPEIHQISTRLYEVDNKKYNMDQAMKEINSQSNTLKKRASNQSSCSQLDDESIVLPQSPNGSLPFGILQDSVNTSRANVSLKEDMIPRLKLKPVSTKGGSSERTRRSTSRIGGTRRDENQIPMTKFKI